MQFLASYIEFWREFPDGQIEFTMKRLTADQREGRFKS
jgi:hypothetical protein